MCRTVCVCVCVCAGVWQDIDTAVLAQIEADCYWCTSILIDKIQDYFTADRPGLQRQLSALRHLIGACVCV